MNEDLKTWAHLAIFESDANDCFGLGCEMYDNKSGIYHIFSLYLPVEDYPNKRQILHRTLPEILAEVTADHTEVNFYAALAHFKSRRELIRKNSVHASGKTLDFRSVRKVRPSVVWLAMDAVKRKTSITEKL